MRNPSLTHKSAVDSSSGVREIRPTRGPNGVQMTFDPTIGPHTPEPSVAAAGPPSPSSLGRPPWRAGVPGLTTARLESVRPEAPSATLRCRLAAAVDTPVGAERGAGVGATPRSRRAPTEDRCMRAIPLPAVGGQGYGVGRLLLTRTAPSAIRAGLSWRGARGAGHQNKRRLGPRGAINRPEGRFSNYVCF